MEDELQRPAALSRKQRVPPGIGIDTYFFREYMESNLIWRLGPPAKRVVPARVWGSIPLFSATGKLSPMRRGPPGKRDVPKGIRFDSVVFRKQNPFVGYNIDNGEVSEWLKEHAWKVCVGLKPTEGSNPSLSAE